MVFQSTSFPLFIYLFLDAPQHLIMLEQIIPYRCLHFFFPLKGSETVCAQNNHDFGLVVISMLCMNENKLSLTIPGKGTQRGLW